MKAAPRSVHIQEHQVRVLNELLHAGSESGARRPINHSVVCTDAEVNLIGFLNTETIRFGIVVYKLCYTVGLADGDNCGLRAQDSWHEVASANIAHT